ncbi:hypothetical protein [Plasmodium yoelii yoelii]|uniref:Uncharacterized protein n=1 Tax=Plasmodium yoelii yoelii TaxID=73239 RepID=Q7RG17_PLAYO|nr:hypothetical protein [Plasmodium yoelii yoelii]
MFQSVSKCVSFSTPQLIQSFPGKLSTQLMHYSQSNLAQSINESSVSYAGIISQLN